MASWSEFAAADSELARYGEKRFERARVAYIATVNEDGSPCVNPVHPVICEGKLLLFLSPEAAKTSNLRRDGRYALHSLVSDLSGTGGEFHLNGQATLIDDDDVRRRAIEAACYTPREQYILFELDVTRAYSATYEDNHVKRHEWRANGA
jgi:hypothetical protein